MMTLLSFLLRELRGSFRQFRIFLLCLILGVGVIATIQTLSAGVEQGLSRNAKALLGGEVELLISNTRITEEQRAFIEARADISLAIELRAMAGVGDEFTLVELKSYDETYPLFGELEVAGLPRRNDVAPRNDDNLDGGTSFVIPGPSADSRSAERVANRISEEQTRNPEIKKELDSRLRGNDKDDTAHASVIHQAFTATKASCGEASRPNEPSARASAIPCDVQEEHHGNNQIIYVESTLLSRLNVQMGDEIDVSGQPFTIGGVIAKEPDKIVGTFSFGPRILMREADLEAAGLLMPGSLVRYRYRMDVRDDDAEGLIAALKKTYPDEPWRLRDFSNVNPRLKQFIDRLELFLTLAGLSTLLIAGLGMAVSVRRFLTKKALSVASFKSLGASRAFVFTLYALLVLIITLIGSVIGVAVGTLGGLGLAPLLKTMLPLAEHITPQPEGLLLAAWYGIITVATFGLQGLYQGVQVKPAALFRGLPPQLPPVPFLIGAAQGALLTGWIWTVVFTSNRPEIALGFVALAAIAFAAFTAMSWLVKAVARRVHVRRPWLRLSIANLHRPGTLTHTVLLSSGLGLTVLVALLLVEGNLQKQVDETIPEIAPSMFFLDIQPRQLDDFIALAKAEGQAERIQTTPNARGRIIAIKGVPIADVKVGPEADWAVNSDRGITYSATQPENATLSAGVWWPEDSTEKFVSLDARVAKGLGVTVGDSISVSILGNEVTAQVANLREIDYATLEINFAMVFSPAAVAHYPHSVLATAWLPDAEAELKLIRALGQTMPNVSVIRIAESLAMVNDVITQISAALSIVVAVTILAGLLVLAAVLSASQEARIYDTVVLKVLGATRFDITRAYLAEWALLALATSGIAMAIGSLGAWLVLQQLRAQKFFFLPELQITTILISLAVVITLGFAGNWRAFSTRPMQVLRNE